MRVRCLLGHLWRVYQHTVSADDGGCFVIAWKQCERCAASRLIHILE